MSKKANGKVKVQLRIDALGIGSVIVDGHDLSHCVRGVDVRAGAGSLMSIDLHLAGVELDADVEALIENIGVTKHNDRNH